MFDNQVASLSGTIIHDLLPSLVQTDLSVEDLRTHVDEAIDLTNTPTAKRQWVRQLVTNHINLYNVRFCPDDAWRLIGSDIAAADVQIDMVWQHGETDAVVIDELKTGWDIFAKKGREQIARQLVYGVGRFGDDFLGVRRVVLRSSNDTKFHLPDQTFTAEMPPGMEVS